MDIEFHLLTISEKEAHPNEAKVSFEKIYNTYRVFLYNVIIKTVEYKSHKVEFSKTILNEVFQHIWINSLDWTFDPKKHKSMDSAFKAYISTIAYYKKLEFLRKNKLYLHNETNIIDDENNDWLFDLTNEEYEVLDNDLSNRNNIIEKVLLTLDEKKRDIVRVYFQQYIEGKKMRPENILYMTQMFDTTWDNIRQIISRVKKEIKTLIDKEVKI
ncbi:RNA polymerase sigma factor [Tamlana sp. I1]|uniref:RNA polymerase sigma factor n=1 Tax=Tamlana sp. I1 TaxID=2762061 RepID=UPI00188FF069|nr:hypothetical protein [Tamlana sp. I1]